MTVVIGGPLILFKFLTVLMMILNSKVVVMAELSILFILTKVMITLKI